MISAGFSCLGKTGNEIDANYNHNSTQILIFVNHVSGNDIT